MVLWKKESNCADAPFVDLFADKTKIPSLAEWNRQLRASDWKNEFFHSLKLNPGKNNETSDFLRNMGNNLFKDGEWIHAMEFYSKSLCFAELGTINVSFAYANRATCFLNLKRYDECLRDIELAEQAKYPKMQKLVERKAKCERFLQTATKKEKCEIKLSFNANEKFSCLADVLDIQRSEKFGRHVIANQDIDVGKTILVEKCFISLGCAPDRVQCYTCTNEERNFIACPGCTDVMFCNENCQLQNDIHGKFCNATINRMPFNTRYVAESILLGINEFSNAIDMMNFVDEILANRSEYIPEGINDSRSKYGLFLSLKPSKLSFVIDEVYKAFTGLLDIPFIREMFDTKQSQRFLMHLIAEHGSIIMNNSIGNSVVNGVVSQELGVIMSLFNHSCAPNLFNRKVVDKELFITTRPIKKGDQLFISYMKQSLNNPLRQMTLRSKFDFVCECDKCQPHCKSTDRKMMQEDSNFQFLSSILEQQYTNKSVEDKCLGFLRKFGHLPWSEELDLVIKIYNDHLFDKFQMK